MGVASLVLGIIGTVLSVFGMGIFGAILGLVGLILAIVGRKNPAKKGVATAGLVLSIIALALGIVTYVACAACIGVAGSLASY